MSTETALRPPTVEQEDEALRRLFEAERTRLFNYCARMVGDRATAEDLAQEVFVKALLALRRRPQAAEDTRASASTWLYSLARNHCLDHLRRRTSWRRLFQRLADLWSGEAGGVEEGVVERHLGERVLARVSARERSLLVMAHCLGFSHAEIAEAHGLAVGSVAVLLHRARTRAARILKEDGHV